MIEIELGQSKHAVCDCCGKGTTSLTRFVYKDGEAHAVYYLAFAENHPERGADGVVSLGEWGVDDVAENRVAFGVKLWQSETENNVSITDAGDSVWREAEIIGRKLSRNEALAHPWLSEVFHVTDHMWTDDPEVKSFFESDTNH